MDRDNIIDRNNIILTGFMGTGKTTVGKMLAKKMGYIFVDTDTFIEERAGQSIPDIFRNRGESEFRKLENNVAKELADKEGYVISTGGKMMLDNDNASVLGRHGRIFCLVATPEEILARVQNDPSQRPLLETQNPLERILELMEQRKKGYGQFHQIVTSNKSPEEVTQTITDLLASFSILRES
ncbi:Shikimate kinase [Desulfamplus magnetovallimortis]|uniref:Shikimate kinase n=1 Tax=Desulfamplus magnetovallimortis TaxID=1246637 RepID=A0A1W1HHC0_9BACT|nr:shikimate kinase [Desulfamplus magnetovallimortis]SLM31840.1 Shikimate kinase [Desulfamplus magnetovallimortis]